ncbi:cytochrome b [Denitromonas ohlonensis]|jgi:cytochrome b561|uniref:Cytochrome b n=2 Tax=Denitromonas TaxID=139331 RepID=A0A557SBD4_9RHOO|nr:cytochrome b [Denitromonas ohlonensis]TVT51117.1 MAG: cytochrome b [Denitromonas halophila]TVO68448.1 cytochrome b [Denitromonas ohlonensis]TVO74726.1 cytochrome b [Denitromonas ohlonensis]TVT71266.1 MAG: cytochrome b [Denitromonas halophila]TVT72255.1 MAG: cytochrome b [Denitromonas halophila]
MTPRYTSTAIALHWLIALGILASFSLGLYMTDLSLSPTKLKLYSWHKWAGVTLFALIVFRLGWRLTHPAPALPDTMPPALRLAASAAHWVLYALMLAIPLSGWLMSSAKGFQTVWFGVLPLPDLLAKDAALGDTLKDVHEALNFTLLAMVGLHVAAALKHHFIDRDTVLTRMLPRFRQS